ncbi:MAG: ATP-dependent helicase [Ignavibacteria bacterium]|jgi:DNA helicase-2/ATP-dependent DNA helicase PcrA|nr:ATP-dependent helicase [Ignavibacteria bacterium]MDH7527576.1 UvrD-helicase domain-containing protein [Ignavibacteria bacterium]
MAKKYILKRVSTDTEPLVKRPEEVNYKIDYKNILNPAQYEAVITTEGPVLVIAGAGTGKTQTLVYRVARLVESGVNPQSILLLTFTRKAAQEMLRRAASLIDSRCEKVSGGTFHSFANMILRKFAEKIGYPSNFTILDQSDAEDVINLIRTNLGFDKQRKRFPKKQTLYDIISLAINKQTTIEHILSTQYPQFIDFLDDIKLLKEEYEKFKKKNALLDYDDLLLKLKELLEKDEDFRRYIHKNYKYIMVDEYQDTNKLQAEIVKLLGGTSRNIMVVGDDSQSIYSFRGANFKNIIDFPKDFPDARIITIEENYRSTQAILNFTNQIIASMIEKYPKRLYTRNEFGELPSIIAAQNTTLESKFVVDKILELREEGISLMDIAVLFRSGYISYDLEIELNKAGIPYRKFGGIKFIETAHIKDLISFLRILNNPIDKISWFRILQLLSGIGPKKARALTDEIEEAVNNHKFSFNSFLKDKSLPDSVFKLFSVLNEASGKSLSPSERLNIILPFYEPILREKYDDFQKRLKDLEIFQAIADRYRSLNSFLDDLALEPPTQSVYDIESPGSEDEFLTLSTIHSAKGLEWHSVFVIGVVEGFFPNTRASESFEDIEEERRLLYVACTRAKRNLFISYPLVMFSRIDGVTYSKKSRFIAPIDQEYYEEWVINEE